MSVDSSLSWEFFSAYRTNQSPLIYNEQLAIQRFGRPLSSGEIGTYTSHYKVWETFLQSEFDQMIVFEDDVLIDWPLINQLAGFDFGGAQIDFLRLFATHPFKFRTAIYRFCSPHSHLVRCEGLVLGIQAYILSRRGAHALLSTGTTIFEPVDWVMARYWRYRVLNYCLFPFPILERYVPSTIGASREAEYVTTIPQKLSRLLWRVQNRILREYVDRVSFRLSRFPPSADVGLAYVEQRVHVGKSSGKL